MDALTPKVEPLILSPAHVDSCVIFLHGLTASGLTFKPWAQQLANVLPKTRFVLPHAPVQPVTWANGEPLSAWYDLRSNNFLENEDERGILQAVAYVHRLIDEQLASGIDSQKIFIGGFSQGCAIALLAGTLYSQTLGGIFGIAGYLPLENYWQKQQHPANRHTPILWQHGSRDPLITLCQTEQGRTLLAKDRTFNFISYPTEHTIIATQVQVLEDWIENRLHG